MVADLVEKKGDVLVEASAVLEQLLDDVLDVIGIEGAEASEIVADGGLVEGGGVEELAQAIDDGGVEIDATSGVSGGEGTGLRLDEGKTTALGREMREPIDSGGGWRRRR